MPFLFVFVLTLCSLPVAAQVTYLSTTAAACPVGTFCELTNANMPGWNNGAIMAPTGGGCTPSDVGTQFQNKMVWNPKERRLQTVGIPHGSCGKVLFVRYTDSSNTWSVGPQPVATEQPAHSYDHNGMDPLTGCHYYRYYNTFNFYKLCPGDTSWTAFNGPSQANTKVCCSAVEFFPDRNLLYFWDNQAGLWSYDDTAWTCVANGDLPNNTPGCTNLNTGSSLGYFLAYSPIARVLIFGDGTKLFRLDPRGTITQMTNPPMAPIMRVGTGGSPGVSLSVDPVSGKFLVMDDSNFYSYDALTDTWVNLSSVSVPTEFRSQSGGVAESLLSTPVTTYGVTAYLKCNDSGGACRIYIYKHTVTTANDLDFFARREGPGGGF